MTITFVLISRPTSYVQPLTGWELLPTTGACIVAAKAIADPTQFAARPLQLRRRRVRNASVVAAVQHFAI